METSVAPRFAYALGVDPGTTTGLAIVRFIMQDDGRPELVWSDQLAWQEACAQVEHRVELLGRMREGGISAVATVELYTINAQTAQRGQGGANDAIGMTGVVRRECFKNNLEFRNNQQASAAKTLIPDITLKALDLFHRGAGHANDAMRHALYLGTKNKWMANRWLAVALTS